MLNLLIHLEMGNQEYLRYELRSLERKLKAEAKLFRVEQALITFLKRWVKDTPLPKHLLSFQQTLRTFNGPHDRQLLRLLDLEGWVDAKIMNYVL